ncbi:uncharacterized protein LOC117115521 [Anneissia japonica]|uniref:uncharacterized protein LOC117115521 n=1 Tax=Anneissia japonica TaxID=1529436 RepID=UPI001425956D|nr:uncharacterized protein LOC117115521 [Anneissia japonica]
MSEEDNVSTPSTDYAFSLTEDEYYTKVNVNMGGICNQMIIDSRASCNVVDKQIWEELKAKKIVCASTKVNKNLYPYGSTDPIEVIGTFTTNMSVENSDIVEAEVMVIKGKGPSLLGRKTATLLGVLKIGLNASINVIQEKANINQEVFHKYKSCFEGIGKLKDFLLEIPIDETVSPVAKSLIRIPFNLREKLENKLDELEKLDVIEKTDGPTPWVSPVVVVPKGDNDIRLCIDMRRANEAII